MARVRRRAPDPAVTPSRPRAGASAESPLSSCPRPAGPSSTCSSARARSTPPPWPPRSRSPRPPSACSWPTSRRTGSSSAPRRRRRRRDRRGRPRPPLRADGGGRGPLPQALRRPHHRAARLPGRPRTPAQVDELFEQRRRRRVAGALPRTAHLPFDEQVAALTAILDEDGYLADAERAATTAAGASPSTTAPSSPWPTGSHRPARASCPSSATRCPGRRCERVAHLMDGAHVCAYVVSPPDAVESAARDLEHGDAVHLVDLVCRSTRSGAARRSR